MQVHTARVAHQLRQLAVSLTRMTCTDLLTSSMFDNNPHVYLFAASSPFDPPAVPVFQQRCYVCVYA
jgi:hypothetical protein